VILSRTTLLKRLRDRDHRRRITVSPILDAELQIGHSSVDLRLGNEFVLVNKATGVLGINPLRRAELADRLSRYQARLEIPYGTPFYLHPHEFSLARTFEYLALPDGVAGYVVGRSSWGRLGLIIATATVVQPGFKGTLVLELANIGSVPVVLYPGMRIAQIVLHTVSLEDTSVGQVPEAVRHTVQPRP